MGKLALHFKWRHLTIDTFTNKAYVLIILTNKMGRTPATNKLGLTPTPVQLAHRIPEEHPLRSNNTKNFDQFYRGINNNKMSSHRRNQPLQIFTCDDYSFVMVTNKGSMESPRPVLSVCMAGR